jgi:hypothetical protein
MSPLAKTLVAELQKARGKRLAIRGAVLATRLGLPGPRGVRDVLAKEHAAITAALLPGVLMCEPPAGYWLSDEPEEMAAMARLRVAAEKRSRERKQQFFASVRAAGWGGVLAQIKWGREAA